MQSTATLVNISTRLNILTGDNVLDGGFIVVGSGFKDVLIRGLGPSLASAGITGTLADPIIELYSDNVIIAENDNWMKNQKTEIEATGLQPTNDAEAALIATLAAGTYTVIERGKQATTGIGLIEIYDLGAGTGPELANISTRGFVDTGSNVMIAGFIIASSTGGSSQVIVRGARAFVRRFRDCRSSRRSRARSLRRQRHAYRLQRQLAKRPGSGDRSDRPAAFK